MSQPNDLMTIAIRDNDEDSLGELIESYPHIINQFDRDRNTPLMVAATSNVDPSIVRLLIDSGADPDLGKWLDAERFITARTLVVNRPRGNPRDEEIIRTICSVPAPNGPQYPPPDEFYDHIRRNLQRISGGGGAARRDQTTESELEKIIKRINQLPNGEDILARICAEHKALQDTISFKIITDPVEVGTGIIYDRSSIERWISLGKNTCPKTRKPMTNIVPNASFRELMISILKPILAKAQQQQKERIKQERERKRMKIQQQRQKMQSEDRSLILRRQFEQLVRSTTDNQDMITQQLSNQDQQRRLSKKP